MTQGPRTVPVGTNWYTFTVKTAVDSAWLPREVGFSLTGSRSGPLEFTIRSGQLLRDVADGPRVERASLFASADVVFVIGGHDIGVVKSLTLTNASGPALGVTSVRVASTSSQTASSFVFQPLKSGTSQTVPL